MKRAYEVITNRIIHLLEEGTIPWHRPWGGPEDHPRNLVSGKNYRGINAFLLSAVGYESPYWLTYRQAKERDGFIKKGEKGIPIIYWNWQEEVDEETGEIKKRPFLKYYTVFNATQCENVEYPKPKETDTTFNPILACENIVSDMPHAPDIELGRTRAAYNPVEDMVSMPSPERFESPEKYYATLFHELVHSTGHESRVGRAGITEAIVFGSATYSKEELIGEMGAGFLCGQSGIENSVIENSASYIASWLARLKGDKKLVVQAGGQAQRAADFILNKQSNSCLSV